MIFVRRRESAVKSCAVSFSLDQNYDLKSTFFSSCKKKFGKQNWEFLSGFRNFAICPDIQNLTSVKTSDLTIIRMPPNSQYSDCYATRVLRSPQPDHGRNKLQRQKILSFIYPLYNHNWRTISTIYIYNKTSIKRNILTTLRNSS